MKSTPSLIMFLWVSSSSTVIDFISKHFACNIMRCRSVLLMCSSVHVISWGADRSFWCAVRSKGPKSLNQIGLQLLRSSISSVLKKGPKWPRTEVTKDRSGCRADLLTARGVAHLVVHGTSGSTSSETIPPVRLETSGGVLSTVATRTWWWQWWWWPHRKMSLH